MKITPQGIAELQKLLDALPDGDINGAIKKERKQAKELLAFRAKMKEVMK